MAVLWRGMTRRVRLLAAAGLALATTSSCLRSQSTAPPNDARTVTRDGVLSFVLDRESGRVTILDLLNRDTATTTSTCADARSGALTDDDVSFVVRCAGTNDQRFINTASYAVVRPPATPALATRPPHMQAPRPNEVLVIGTIHAEHRASARYGTAVLRDLLRAARPDFILTEIAPNRFDAALEQFRSTGTITESRVVRFPEYVDVLFPLTREMSFTIVPTAGWSRPMDVFRAAALTRIAADPARARDWAEYTRANDWADSIVAARGADDPYYINSDAYDAVQTAAHEPYNRLFNQELGPGGWDNINVAHYALIARALDAHVGEGKRFVITYGAGHKEWFMRELRKRRDIVILDAAPFLDQAGARRPR